ncbi:hypothetical protein [Microlunatus sp. Y2014]|uniref:hypothetical protein n=1 Tax=Microlunatus sp. Y2014 TaxID=3418488 RepID=UPI003DA797D0
MLNRRSLLGAGTATALAVSAGAVPRAAAAPVVEPIIYGPASTSVIMRGAAHVGNSMFMTSRFMLDGKVRIIEVDLTTGKVLWHDDVLLSPDHLAAGGGNTMTSDGRHAYICPHGLGTLFRLDPQTHEVTELAADVAAPQAQWYECTVVDGHVFAGAYPDAEVVRVDPATGDVFNYGRIPGPSPYVGAIAVGDGKVWATGKGASNLVEWPLDGGEPRTITEFIGRGYTSAIDMAYSDGLLYFAVGRYLMSFDPTDGSRHVEREIRPEDRYIDYMCVAADGTVYATARTSGNVYRVEADGLTLLGAPLAGDGSNLTLTELEPGVLCGASDKGRVFVMRVGEPATVFTTEDQGVGLPDRIMTIFAHSDGTVWAAGSGSFTVHDLANDTRRRKAHIGEIKCFVEGPEGAVYAMQYPGCTILRVDRDTLELTEVGAIDQYRPNAVLYDARRQQLIISSGPSLGLNQGAVSFFDLTTGAVETRKDYLPQQIAYGMVIHAGMLHVVGDVYGEATGAIRDLGQIASVDLATRELRHRSSPVADGRSYRDIAVHRGRVYVQLRRPEGLVVRFDPVAGTAVAVGDVGSYGDIASYRSSLVHTTRSNAAITLQEGESFDVRYSGLPDGWYSAPHAPVSVSRGGVYGLHGGNLAFYPLP